MDVKLLIDDIVRQTTVLIAQLSTASGVRAPLAHVAGQVFLELAREIEGQGVGRKIAADMFGLALRSYQLKVQRLTEGARPESSLWQDVHAALENSPMTKKELGTTLAPAAALDIAAVLNDLVGSGLAYSSGRGQSAVFGLTTAADRARLSRADSLDTATQMVWLCIATGRAETRAELAAESSLSAEVVSRALAVLAEEGRVSETAGRLVAETLYIPAGSEQGWEVAVSDHFRAVASAIITKLRVGKSDPSDRVGGSTVAFTITAGHPFEEQVYGLLERTRRDVNGLWGAVSAFNQKNPPPDVATRVTFYFGQDVTQPELNEPGIKELSQNEIATKCSGDRIDQS